MTDIADLGALDAAKAMARGELTSEALVGACLARIAARDGGRKISDEQYADAIARAHRFRESLVRLLEDDLIILAPATDGVAPPITEEGTGSPSLQGLYTMTGLPALAVPCGMFEGMPIGVQLVASPGREAILLGAARSICAANWRTFPSTATRGKGSARTEGQVSPW